MKNKILVELVVPEIEKTYNVYIPINRRVGNVISLLNKSVYELSGGVYKENSQAGLYNRDTGMKYNINYLIRATDIRNGTSLVLL